MLIDLQCQTARRPCSGITLTCQGELNQATSKVMHTCTAKFVKRCRPLELLFTEKHIHTYVGWSHVCKLQKFISLVEPQSASLKYDFLCSVKGTPGYKNKLIFIDCQ